MKKPISTHFPPGFLWGAATSSHQVDGNNRHSDWWHWEQEGHVANGEKSGVAIDHWNRFKEDLQLAARLGLNSYRFSIEWAKIEPEEGQWDDAALGWYSELLSECEKLGLMPMATLHHFTLPQWLAKGGGLTHPRFADFFSRYVERVADRIGSRIPLWCTINEPMVLVLGAYIGKFMPPAIFNPMAASQACHNLLRAHVRAYDLLHSLILRRSGPWSHLPIQVGIAHNLVDFIPDRRWHLLEVVFARVLHQFYNCAWLDAITGRSQHFGIRGLIPRAKTVSSAHHRITADFIGINYYMKANVQWRPKTQSELHTDALPFEIALRRQNEDASDMGWAMHPKGLGKLLRFAKGYHLPLHVTENGIADRQDRLRPNFLVSHLEEIATALQSGTDVRGYYHWSLFDNFEWSQGFGPRFGLYQVDPTTLERQETGSARLYRDLIAAHRDHWGLCPPENFPLKS